MKMEKFIAGILATVNGVEFYAIGKKGVHLATGTAVECYATEDDSERIWISAKGEVFAD